VLRLAVLNASLETGIENPIDAAILAAAEAPGLTKLGSAGWTKVDEIPYDFIRKRLTVVVHRSEDPLGAPRTMIVKGAFPQVVAACTTIRTSAGGVVALDDAARRRLEAHVQHEGSNGIRVIAVATRLVPPQDHYTIADEAALCFEGFVAFADPPKPDAAETVRKLAGRGVRVKIITGDSRHVAAHVAEAVGLDPRAMLTGEALARLRDEALWHLAERTDLFAEVDPAQKERIVRALQRTGHAVGYLGDGINDAPALHAADVGISVDQAVDVARESADIVLLQSDLGVLLKGIEEGRRTFANTMTYIQTTTSANFLPLTATQILLNNLLSDLPSLAIAGDRTDEETLQQAQRWNVGQVRRFMVLFGLVSSAFDLLTFAVLRLALDAPAPLFHASWFVVSLLTELVALWVLRTRRRAWKSWPSPLLVVMTLAVALVALAWPFLPPMAGLLGFVAIPPGLLVLLLAIVAAYAVTLELLKPWAIQALGTSRSQARP
jgi:Mg2+-importing ATPase